MGLSARTRMVERGDIVSSLNVSIDSLRWAVGGLCALIGMMMLVVPHQFNTPVYAAIAPQLPLWGSAFLAGGVGLFALASMNLSRPVELAIHLLAGVDFLVLAYGMAVVGGWTGTSNFASLGLGTTIAPFLANPRRRRSTFQTRSLLPLLIGLASTLTGVAILVAPGQFNSPLYDDIRPYLWLFGLAFFGNGIALAYANINTNLPVGAFRVAHLLAGGTLLSFFIASSVPLRAWTGMAYYGGIGLAILILPWLRSRFGPFDPTSLQSRLALTLSLIVALPLVLVVTLVDVLTGHRTKTDGQAAIADELSFLVLVATIVVAVATGVYAARWLTAPLSALARAAQRLAAGEGVAPLPRTSVSEIAQLASVFGEMRDQLEARAAERERILIETERRALELSAVNKELEAFAYSVSHDLRAPYRRVDGFSKALLADYAEKFDDRGKKFLLLMREESERMGQLIDSMLGLSRVTRSEMRRHDVDLSALAQEIADELSATQPERRVAFQIAPGLMAAGDGRLLRVALENLLGNACKFTAKHATAQIEFGVAERDGERTYFVRDDGAGFDAAYSDKLFGVFQRLHGDDEFPGIGVGLATVQRVIHRHGGRVWAEGGIEQGATFYFTLGNRIEG